VRASAVPEGARLSAEVPSSRQRPPLLLAPPASAPTPGSFGVISELPDEGDRPEIHLGDEFPEGDVARSHFRDEEAQGDGLFRISRSRRIDETAQPFISESKMATRSCGGSSPRCRPGRRACLLWNSERTPTWGSVPSPRGRRPRPQAPGRGDPLREDLMVGAEALGLSQQARHRQAVGRHLPALQGGAGAPESTGSGRSRCRVVP
jgi:hypothetical protein